MDNWILIDSLVPWLMFPVDGGLTYRTISSVLSLIWW